MRTPAHAAIALRCVSVLAGACIGLLFATAPAGAHGSTIYPWVNVSAACGTPAITVGMEGEDDGQHPEIVGFDVYRRTHGVCGDTEKRITANPIARLAGQSFSFQVTDAEASPGVLYYYQIFGVDAGRTTRTDLYTLYWMPGSNDAAYAGCGRTLAGHGTIEDGAGFWELHPCPESCFQPVWIESWNVDLSPYVGTGTPLALYGSFGWGVEGFTMIVDAFEVRSCTTGLQPVTWGGMKRLYE